MAEASVLDVDVPVLGAGPVGLCGAYYAGFRGLPVAVIDGPDDIGGQVQTQCDLLVASLGFTTKLGPIASCGLEFDGRHVKVGSDMQTSLPSVYAAGDVSEYAGKVRLISGGFGEAAIAVNHLAASLDPGPQVFPGHSTHHGN